MDLNPEVLRKWRDEAAREIGELEERLKPLHAELQARRELAAAIDRALGLLESLGSGTPAPPEATPNPIRTPPRLVSLADAALDLLQKEKAPLHYREIARRLTEMGVAIPGENPEANLVAHMSRDDRFVRVARGTYALSSWDISPAPTARRARRRRS